MLKRHSPGPFTVQTVDDTDCKGIIDARGRQFASTDGVENEDEDTANAALLAASAELEVMLAETIGMLSALIDDRSPLPAAARSVLRKQHDDALKLLHRIAHGVTT